MDSDGPGTVILTVAAAEWRQAIDNLDALSARIVLATLERAARSAWPKRGEVGLLLTDDREIRSLNGRYRGRDRPTNVLSFPGFDLDEGQDPAPQEASPQPASGPQLASGPQPTLGPVLLGDIAMSFERLAEEAVERRKDMADHFAHLLVHGTLHLLGYDHGDDDQATVMEGLEASILDDLGFAAPYAPFADADAAVDATP